jgi:hypothetical protein
VLGRGGVTNPNCPICHGIGWVCENHPDKPWDSELGCNRRAGMPCECNAVEEGEEPDVSGVMEERPATRH